MFFALSVFLTAEESAPPEEAGHVDWRSTARFVNFLLRLPTGFGPTEHLRAFLLVRLPDGPWHDRVVPPTVLL